MASDLYQLGLVLFEMLTGRGPFDERHGIEAVIGAHVSAKPPVLSSVSDQDLPAALDEVMARTLAKRPAERPRSARELMLALRQVLPQAAATPGETGPGGTELLDRDGVFARIEAATGGSAGLAGAQSSTDGDDTAATVELPTIATDEAASPAAKHSPPPAAPATHTGNVRASQPAPIEEPRTRSLSLGWVLVIALVVFALGLIVARFVP